MSISPLDRTLDSRSSDNSFEVNVRTITGKNITISVHPNTTVAELKRQIHQKEDIRR